MDEIRILVEDTDSFFERALSAARRIEAGDLAPQPATYSLHSVEALFSLLTSNRWELLRTLRGTGRSSIRALSKALGRDYRGVHSDVTVLLNAGLIEKDSAGRIHVPWSKITAEMVFDTP
ncbi:MAG: hypothetical protein Q8Q62_19785, partial [Mesorhizobium sp.]|nr:hypothetical protein [Mesorhizobium sp.]